MVIELRVVQFWSEIIRIISDQIALRSVQLPLQIISFMTTLHGLNAIQLTDPLEPPTEFHHESNCT